MSTREEFFKKIEKQAYTRYEMPDMQLTEISYPDKVGQFINMMKVVGGHALVLKEGEDLNSLIASIHPDAKKIASNLSGITLATICPDAADDPHTLDGIDLSIVEGEIGVAENGCIWIPQQVRQKVIYFISEYLVILLDRDKLVSTMHDAYRRIENKEYGFGVFISGPSKTADIEQALVTGAHGARGVTVIIR